MNRRLFLAGVACAVLAGLAWLLWPWPVRRDRGPLPQEAYLWQRAWTGPVAEAVAQHATRFGRLVALGAEVTWRRGEPRVVRVAPDYEALRRCGRPIGLALRIGPFAGPFAADDARAQGLAGLAASLLAEAASNQLAAAELQIDFDCAESKLQGYGCWVRAIRARIAPVPVVITALPAWLRRGTFPALADLADGYVLQVHSLERPADILARFTLCDPGAARRAVERAGQLGRPFRVALPTYGYDIAFDTQGRFAGLSAEGPSSTWPADARMREVQSDPAALAGLVRGWTLDRPAGLRGIIWYRLPVAGDRHNWAWPTLAEVMEGRTPKPSLQARLRRPQAGLIEVDLNNAGTAEPPDPVTVELRWEGARRVAGDALLGFDYLEAGRNVVQFKSNPAWPRLPPGETCPIGWLRLDQDADVRIHIRNCAQ